MKSCVLVEPNRLEIQEKPGPAPGPGEVLVRVRAVGICGSDTHYFAGWRDHEPSTVYPFVLGHEFAGEVAETGPGVDSVVEGARVMCSPDRPCGRCEWCASGLENVCPNVQFAGSAGVEGCLSQYYVVNVSQLHQLPDSVGFAEATLCEPLAIGLHIIDNLVQPCAGESCAVIGAGPIGLVSTFCARLRGMGDVFASDRVKARAKAASRYGANETCEVEGDRDFEHFIAGRTGGRGVDVVIEAGGEASSIAQAALLARVHGRVVIEGIPPGGEAPLCADAARRKELTVIFGRRSLRKTREALDLVEAGTFDARGLITHEFPLQEAQSAFECTRDYRDGVIKAVIRL